MKTTIIKLYKHKKLIAAIKLQDNVIVVEPKIAGIQAEVEMMDFPMFDTTYKITDYKIIPHAKI